MQRHWDAWSTSNRKNLQKASVAETVRSRESVVLDKVKRWFDCALDTEERVMFI